MGFLNGLVGNNSKVSTEKVVKEFDKIFGNGEEVEVAYKLIRDTLIFTNFRIIIIDIQGITGKKVEITSIPYKSISKFSIETTGHMDLDAELKIWFGGDKVPMELKFGSTNDIYEVQSILAQAIVLYAKAK